MWLCVGIQGAAALGHCNHEGQGGSNSSPTTIACVSALPALPSTPVRAQAREGPALMGKPDM